MSTKNAAVKSEKEQPRRKTPREKVRKVQVKKAKAATMKTPSLKLGNEPTTVLPYDDIEDAALGEYNRPVPQVVLPIISAQPRVEVAEEVELSNDVVNDLQEVSQIVDEAVEAAHLSNEEVKALFTMANAIVKMVDALEERGADDGLLAISSAVDLVLMKQDLTVSEKPVNPELVTPAKSKNPKRYFDLV